MNAIYNQSEQQIPIESSPNTFVKPSISVDLSEPSYKDRDYYILTPKSKLDRISKISGLCIYKVGTLQKSKFSLGTINFPPKNGRRLKTVPRGCFLIVDFKHKQMRLIGKGAKKNWITLNFSKEDYVIFSPAWKDRLRRLSSLSLENRKKRKVYKDSSPK